MNKTQHTALPARETNLCEQCLKTSSAMLPSSLLTLRRTRQFDLRHFPAFDPPFLNFPFFQFYTRRESRRRRNTGHLKGTHGDQIALDATPTPKPRSFLFILFTQETIRLTLLRSVPASRTTNGKQDRCTPARRKRTQRSAATTQGPRQKQLPLAIQQDSQRRIASVADLANRSG